MDKFIDARGRPEINELCEHVGVVGLRIDAVQFASFDERSNAAQLVPAIR
jgi:hypothetical protein